MVLTEFDLSQLLAALKAGEMTDTIRANLEWMLQHLIEAEATVVIGAAPMSALRPRPRSATAIGRGRWPPQLGTWS